jgi:hypothetical protein
MSMGSQINLGVLAATTARTKKNTDQDQVMDSEDYAGRHPELVEPVINIPPKNMNDLRGLYRLIFGKKKKEQE